jgi:hypothetical protein
VLRRRSERTRELRYGAMARERMEELSRTETMALLRSVKRNREPRWRKGAARVFQEDLDPVWLGEGIRGGGSGWLGLALDRWLKREGKESRHLRALSLEKTTIVELLST